MRASLLTLLMGGCAWVTPAELDTYREGCTCEEGATTWYPDEDGDGWGLGGDRVRCSQRDGWVDRAGDCDDGDAAVNPDAQEQCDLIDDDCDGEIDERGSIGEVRWYEDADHDGWGDEATWLSACTPPSGYVSGDELGDCDDSDADVHPEAEEVCGNQLDDDCDGGPGDCGLQGEVSWAYADLVVGEDSAGDGLGVSMVGGADLLGSTYDDVILGAPGWVGEHGAAGAVLVYPGTLEGLDTLETGDASAILEGPSEVDLAGRSLALLPDLQGDGEFWLAVGCTPADPAAGSSGAVYLLDALDTGTADLAEEAAISMDDAVSDAAFGFAMDGGYVNDDGLTDLAVGAPGAGGLRGEVRLFVGPLSSWGGVGQAVAIIQGPSAGAEAGRDVALSDLNGDGLADLLAGAPGDGGLGTVALFLVPSSSSTWSDADAQYLGPTVGCELGTAVAAGDTDGDGYGDYLIGAPEYNGHGRVWLLLGSNYPPSSLSGAEAHVETDGTDDRLGAALAGIGDFNGDGFGDIAVGAPSVDDPWEGTGHTALLYGPISGISQLDDADVVIHGPSAGSAAGTALVGAGDLERDGFADLLVGAAGAGQVALFRGQGW